MIEKILLISPPYLFKQRSLPLGLAYLRSFLKREGYSVDIIDMATMNISYKGLQNAIRRLKPDVVGISFMTVQANNAQKVAQSIKELSQGIIIVAGGVHVSALPDETLKQGNFDFAVCGEGEETLKELLMSLGTGQNDFSRIKGLAFMRGDKVVVDEKRELIDNLDSLPFPDWSGLPIRKYSDFILTVEDNSPVLPILATRGCPNDCIFCASNVIFRRRLRARSAENIVKEIMYLMERCKTKNFSFVDDTLTLDKNMAIELCDLIIGAGLNINWKCNSRVSGFDEDLAFKLKAAGCKNVSFGVESADPEVLKAINKRISLPEVISAKKAAEKAGLVVSFLFMVGNVGESKESVRKTLGFIKENNLEYATCTIATPYPGTMMYEIGRKNGWIATQDWDQYETTPHVKRDYIPFWSNGLMSAQEILDAYYYVNSKLIMGKINIHYGHLYYLNPKFYRDEIIKRIKAGGLKGILGLIYKLLRLKNIIMV